MGGGSFDHRVYASVSSVRATKSIDDVFEQNTKKEMHKDLDPYGIKFRESCDSAEHPESNAVAIWFDQSGSMGRAPEIFAKSALGNLMKILLAKGYLDHPQILFGCFGDFSDRVGVIQMGQFESDQRIDGCLTKMWLVGNGGGTLAESSQLGMYAMARHTKIDCFDKRGKKGYLFFVTDEMSYPEVSAFQVNKIFGDILQEDIPVEQILEELKARYEVFVVYLHTNHYTPSDQKQVRDFWKKLMGERLLDLDDPAHICETVGATIGLCEGRDVDGITRDLLDLGSASGAVHAAVKATALVPVAASGGGLAKATVTGAGLPVAPMPVGGTERL